MSENGMDRRAAGPNGFRWGFETRGTHHHVSGGGRAHEIGAGALMTATLVPEGRFANIAANLGSLPSAFAQFQSDKDGKPSILRLTFASAQAYNFKRE